MLNYLEIKDICQYNDVTIGKMFFHVNGENATLMCMWRTNRGIKIRDSCQLPRGEMKVRYPSTTDWLPALSVAVNSRHCVLVEPLYECNWESFGNSIYLFRDGDEFLNNNKNFQTLIQWLRDQQVNSIYISENKENPDEYYFCVEDTRSSSLRELIDSL